MKNVRIIEQYRGCDVAEVNCNNKGGSLYLGIIINGNLSCIALISVKACKNVIDTHFKFNKPPVVTPV